MTTCRQVGSPTPPRWWAWFLCYFCLLVTLTTKTPLVDAARFAVTGPVLTITLKDPATSSRSGSSSSSRSFNDESSPSWGLNLKELQPTLNWSVQSKSKPLPNWLPSLQSIRSSLGYNYQESHKYIPSNLESEAVFASSRSFFKGISLKVQPSYEFRSKRGVLQLQATKGASSYALAQFTTTTSTSTTGKQRRRWLTTLLKGCLQIDLPYASVGGISITPSYDWTRNKPSCTLEAMTGSQRTKAIVQLEYENPTLSIAHTLAECHVITPEISLYTGRIVYQWNIALESGSIRTKVDPTDAVYVTWTDKSTTGKWVTDLRVPLSGTVRSALAASIKVRRQFSF